MHKIRFEHNLKMILKNRLISLLCINRFSSLINLELFKLLLPDQLNKCSYVCFVGKRIVRGWDEQMPHSFFSTSFAYPNLLFHIRFWVHLLYVWTPWNWHYLRVNIDGNRKVTAIVAKDLSSLGPEWTQILLLSTRGPGLRVLLGVLLLGMLGDFK